MKDQLKLLEVLQRHDARIQELDGALKAIPAKIEAMRADLRRVEEMLTRERSELAETEQWRRSKEIDMKAEEEQLVRAKAKLGFVKTSKEYMATQREVETNRKVTAETEEKLLSVIEASDQARQRIDAHDQDVQKLRERVEEEEVASRAKLDELTSESAKLRTERDEAAKAVRADVMKKYGTIRMRRGLAVVPVANGTCRGCNMNIPPQLFNILQRGDSLELCPNCNRIIYWDKLMVESPPSQ